MTKLAGHSGHAVPDAALEYDSATHARPESEHGHVVHIARRAQPLFSQGSDVGIVLKNYARTQKPLDFGSSSGCSPQCTTGTSTCSCTETCNGHTYTMSCGGSSSTSCGCEIDQVTQPTSIIGGPCTDGAGLESTFIAQCGPKT